MNFWPNSAVFAKAQELMILYNLNESRIHFLFMRDLIQELIDSGKEMGTTSEDLIKNGKFYKEWTKINNAIATAKNIIPPSFPEKIPKYPKDFMSNAALTKIRVSLLGLSSDAILEDNLLDDEPPEIVKYTPEPIVEPIKTRSCNIKKGTENEDDSKVDLSKARSTAGRKSKKGKDEPTLAELYPVTNAHFDGDYFEWYDKFIQPTFGRLANPMGEIHHQWADDIESDNFTIHLEPRDHYKTTFIDAGYALYNLCEDLLSPILIISLSKRIAQDVFAKIKFHLYNNKPLMEFYGFIVDEEKPVNATQLSTIFQPEGEKDPSLFCATVKSRSIMGTHPKLCICDDIEDRPLSAAEMYALKIMLEQSLIPALGTWGKLIICGTIKGWDVSNDIYLYLISKENMFSVFKSPAVYECNELGDALYDQQGYLIPAMPPMEHVEIIKERVMVVDAETGNPIRWKSTRNYPNNPAKSHKKGDIKYAMRLKAIVTVDAWKYKSIYPEGYTVGDIVIKRMQLHDRDKDSDTKFFSEYQLQASSPSGKFFDINRVKALPTEDFTSINEMIRYAFLEAIPIVLWIDPGGRTGHGCAIAVLAIIKGKFCVFEVEVVYKGLKDVAMHVARLLIKYHIIKWGVEGNFNQAELYGERIADYILKYFEENGIEAQFTHPLTPNNDTNKIGRIQSRISYRLGSDPTPSQFYVNKTSPSYGQFVNELTMFGSDETGNSDFDTLDAIASADIHLIGEECSTFWLDSSNYNEGVNFLDDFDKMRYFFV